MKEKRKKGTILLAVMMALLSFSGCAESQAKELTVPAECSEVVLEAKAAVDQEIEKAKKAEAKAKAEAEAKAKAEAEAKAKAEAEAAAAAQAAQAAQQQTYNDNYSNADGCIDNAEGLLW